MKKKKIGLFIPALARGGAERVISILSKEISKDKSIDLKLILVDDTRIDYDYGGEKVSLGINLPRENLMLPKNIFLRLFHLYRWHRKLKAIKNEQNFDQVISFLTYSNLINITSRKKEKVIISVRSFPSELTKGIFGKFNKLFLKLFYKKADLIIAVSEIIKKDLVENFKIDKDKIHVIYNPINNREVAESSTKELEKKYRTIFKNPSIINVGRLTHAKAQWHLIRGFKNIKEKIPNAQLIILGEGELEIYLKALAKDSGLEKNIHFLGFQKNPFKFIKNSDIFVFPSIYEGFGNVIIESMACGKPIISSDCRAGPREILAPKTNLAYSTKKPEYADYGILIPVCDGKKRSVDEKLTKEEEILADEIIKLLKNCKLRKKYESKSKKRVKDFEMKKIVREWTEIL